MHQEKVTIRSQSSPVSRRTQRSHDTVGICLIRYGIFHIHRTDFIQCGSNTGSSWSITRFIRNVRCIHIPIRDQVSRHCFMILHEIECFQRLVQIFAITRFTVANNESVNSPRLSAAPGRFMRISLCRMAVTNGTIFQTIIDDMVTAAVRTEMFLQRTVCMSNRYVIKRGITG